MNPHAFGGDRRVPLELPPLEKHAVRVATPGAIVMSHMKPLSAYLSEVIASNAAARNFRIVCPDELESNRLGDVARGHPAAVQLAAASGDGKDRRATAACSRSSRSTPVRAGCRAIC